MNYDEFAFFNQQLAAMLREGIPLEGALKQLSAGMKHEPLRTELQRLEDDLARGTPLPEAVGRRRLPELYRRMVEIGAKGDDLPGVLTLLADYYQRAGALWSRLKGLLVYPVIVIGASLVISAGLSLIFSRLLKGFMEGLFEGQPAPVTWNLISMWAAPVLLLLVATLGIAAILNPSTRAWLRWRVPGFREAGLTQLASALSLLIRNGTPLPDALALVASLESNSPAGKALVRWRQLIQSGQGKPAQWPESLPPFPPLFLWLAKQGGDDPAGGFQKAAQMYHSRASHRIELLLYCALPVSVLVLGQMILWQFAPLFHTFITMMNMLGSGF